MITNKKQSIIKPNRISMDTLGIMIKNGFVEADANLRREVGTINKRIDGLETKIGNRIDGLETKINKKIDGLEVKIGGLGSRVGSIETKIDNLETKMDSGFSGLNAQLSSMSWNFVTFSEHNVLKDRVRKIEKKLA